MKSAILFINILVTFSLFGQLKPSLGLEHLPDNSEEICRIPLYLGSFNESGLQPGDTIPHFALYSSDGSRYDIGEILNDGKPVVLIGGNYTCPVFRDKINQINDLQQEFSDVVNIYIVYGVEAHPAVDTSPYFGRVNTGNRNVNDNVIYRQPTNYGERVSIVNDLLNDFHFDVPILIDGPCNRWWETFGPAPTNAYLINVNGVVSAKHGWFNRSPNDMACDIRELLYNERCENEPLDGQFTFELLGDSLVKGSPGEVLYVYGELKNTSKSDVEIDMRRLVENVPSDWATSMCVDVCYPADQDQAVIILKSGESKLYTMYFYTAGIPADGMVRMGFRNTNDRTNRYVVEMFATTEFATSVHNVNNDLSIYPNPILAGTKVYFSNGSKIRNVRMINNFGQEVFSQPIFEENLMVPGHILPGAYTINFTTEKNELSSVKLLVVK